MISKKRKETVDNKVTKFYNSIGWKQDENGDTVDAQKWEDLRKCSQKYLQDVRKRLGSRLPRAGKFFFDLGSGPIQYPEYLLYSKNFDERHCVDSSESALKIAKTKASNIKTFWGNFFDIPFPSNTYDCLIAQHVLYHIDKNRQYEAVQKMIDITKPGGTIAIIYGNPNSPLEWPYKFYRTVKICFGIKTEYDLYHFTYPLHWWRQFEKKTIVNMYPWRTFNAFYMKKLVPNSALGSYFLKILFKLENSLPNFLSVKIAQYPVII